MGDVKVEEKKNLRETKERLSPNELKITSIQTSYIKDAIEKAYQCSKIEDADLSNNGYLQNSESFKTKSLKSLLGQIETGLQNSEIYKGDKELSSPTENRKRDLLETTIRISHFQLLLLKDILVKEYEKSKELDEYLLKRKSYVTSSLKSMLEQAEVASGIEDEGSKERQARDLTTEVVS